MTEDGRKKGRKAMIKKNQIWCLGFILQRVLRHSPASAATFATKKMADSNHPTPENVQENLGIIVEKVRKAYESADIGVKNPEKPPRLVAVSKLKPVTLIRACYDSGQRVFGENYVQELLEKASSEELLENCPEIQWHFIGNLQSNKIGKVCSGVPRLACIETVDSEKMAKTLNTAWGKNNPDSKLGVMVQVNTSGEGQKSGLDPENEALDVAEFILETCDNLEFRGFMTIGALGSSLQASQVENPDFRCLVETRDKFCARRGIQTSNVELSMGMSNDFEEAIKAGSTNVRVGSTIFGVRKPKK